MKHNFKLPMSIRRMLLEKEQKRLLNIATEVNTELDILILPEVQLQAVIVDKKLSAAVLVHFGMEKLIANRTIGFKNEMTWASVSIEMLRDKPYDDVKSILIKIWFMCNYGNEWETHYEREKYFGRL